MIDRGWTDELANPTKYANALEIRRDATQRTAVLERPSAVAWLSSSDAAGRRPADLRESFDES